MGRMLREENLNLEGDKMAGKSELSINVNVLIKKESDYYVAHCLELDIVATARTLSEVRKDIFDLVTTAIDYAFAHDNLDNLYRPAPPEVWRTFSECKESIEKKKKLTSRFKEEMPDSFVPPWITARMCRMDPCHAL